MGDLRRVAWNSGDDLRTPEQKARGRASNLIWEYGEGPRPHQPPNGHVRDDLSLALERLPAGHWIRIDGHARSNNISTRVKRAQARSGRGGLLWYRDKNGDFIVYRDEAARSEPVRPNI